MSWDEKAEDHASAHHTYEHRGYCENMLLRKKFVDGAKWMRDQLRTDEAVERVADHLYQDEYGHPMSEHHTWCQIEDCTNTEDFRGSARTAITSLLGDEPRP